MTAIPYPDTMVTKAMGCSEPGSRTINQFAVVSYLPEPLAGFLDQLRLDLTPDSNPHAHVTVLPPRPIPGDTNLDSAIRQLTEGSAVCQPFEIRLGAIDVFPVSNVIFAELAIGSEILHELHGKLNSGLVQFSCPFPYHPHITIAQDIQPGQVEAMLQQARDAWASYLGPRSFHVGAMSFVQNVARGIWVDIAKIPLGSAAAT